MVALLLVVILSKTCDTLWNIFSIEKVSKRVKQREITPPHLYHPLSKPCQLLNFLPNKNSRTNYLPSISFNQLFLKQQWRAGGQNQHGVQRRPISCQKWITWHRESADQQVDHEQPLNSCFRVYRHYSSFPRWRTCYRLCRPQRCQSRDVFWFVIDQRSIGLWSNVNCRCAILCGKGPRHILM